MELPDPASSQVVLIGVAQYDDAELADLPSVRRNLATLRQVVTAPDVWGVPSANVTVIDDGLLRGPGGTHQAVKLTRIAADKAVDALVVYYSGHGLPHQDGEEQLFLAMPGSDQREASSTALPFDEIRLKVNSSAAQRKVIILDCCSSGLALGGRMTAFGPDRSPILPGMAVLTATSQRDLAMAPLSGDMSAFTAELVRIMTDGIPAGPDYLDMASIFATLSVRLAKREFPRPAFGSAGSGATIALARNRLAAAVTLLGDADETIVPLVCGLIEAYERVLPAGPSGAREHLDTALRLLTSGPVDRARLSAVYAALSSAGLATAGIADEPIGDPATVAVQQRARERYLRQISRFDEAVDRFVSQVRSTCGDVLRDLAEHPPELSDRAARRAALTSWASVGSGRSQAMINAYASALATQILERMQAEVQLRTASRFSELVDTMRGLTAGADATRPADDAFPGPDTTVAADLRSSIAGRLGIGLRDETGEQGPGDNRRWLGFLGAGAGIGVAAGFTPVGLVMVAVAGTMAFTGGKRPSMSSIGAQVATAMIEALSDPAVREELIEVATRGIRAAVDAEFAPIRRALETAGEMLHPTFGDRMSHAQRRIERILDEGDGRPADADGLVLRPRPNYRPRHSRSRDSDPAQVR